MMRYVTPATMPTPMMIGTMLAPASLLDFLVDVPARTDGASESDPAEFAPTGAAVAATGIAVIAMADAPRIHVLIISHSLMYEPVRPPRSNDFDIGWFRERGIALVEYQS